VCVPQFIAVIWLAFMWPLTPLHAAPAGRNGVVTPQHVLSRYGGDYHDPKLHAMLAGIVGRLSAASGQSDLHCTITVLNSPAVNAFAFPDGELYVTRGLLALANDSAEVASALALVIARHAVTRKEQARKAKQTDSLNVAALTPSKIGLTSFSRSQVMEADTIGIGIVTHAGFDPYGAWRLLKSMGRHAELRAAGSDTRLLDFVFSESTTSDRVKNVFDSARNMADGGARNNGRDNTGYLHNIDGITYGDDADEGFVRGRRFIHPKLGFSFMAPEGFTLDNTAQAVLGSKENESQTLRLDTVKLPANRSLVKYLQSGWLENIDDGSIEEFLVNNIPAATTTASLPIATESRESWRLRLFVVKFGGKVYRFIFAAVNLTEDADKSFRESIQTFRRLSEREETERPLRLKVIKVQPGDTIESLAVRMIFADHQVERFQVLNGLEPGAELKPGDLVKIVVE
jgi:predicted Zn-dependent protease